MFFNGGFVGLIVALWLGGVFQGSIEQRFRARGLRGMLNLHNKLFRVEAFGFKV